MVLKGILSETKYACVLTYQVSSLQHNSNEFLDGVKQTPKKPTLIRVKKEVKNGVTDLTALAGSNNALTIIINPVFSHY